MMDANTSSLPPIAEWVNAISALVETVESDRFPGALRQFLSLSCSFDSMVIMRHDETQPPEPLYQDLDELQSVISVEFYAGGPYLLDPLYQACRKGYEPGAYRLLDLAPEAFYRSEYYRTFYRKIGISDEIGILVPDRKESWFIVSLARVTRRQRFEESDTTQLNAVFNILATSVRRQWGQGVDAAQGLGQDNWEDKIQTFGVGVLSPREREVIQLILLGHSTPSAAAFLGIAEGTVKVHRHNAYSKLRISSQTELFSVASRHFTETGNA